MPMTKTDALDLGRLLRWVLHRDGDSATAMHAAADLAERAYRVLGAGMLRSEVVKAWPTGGDEPLTPERLAEIRETAAVFSRSVHCAANYWAAADSAADVPVLLAEVERLRGELAEERSLTRQLRISLDLQSGGEQPPQVEQPPVMGGNCMAGRHDECGHVGRCVCRCHRNGGSRAE